MADKKTLALNRVIETAGAMILEMPFSDISVAEIAARANCSTATIYEVYGTKDNLYVDALGQQLLTWAPPEPSRGDGTAFADILSYARARIDYFAHPRTRALFRALRERSDRGAVIARNLMELRASFGTLVELVDAAFDEDLLRRSDAESVAYLIVAGAIYEANAAGEIFGVRALVDCRQIVHRLFTPLVTTIGAAELDRFVKSIPQSDHVQRLPLTALHRSTCEGSRDSALLRQTLVDLGIPSPHARRH